MSRALSSTYVYAGLDDETGALALELESLGGGDAALGRFEVHAVVDERIEVVKEKKETSKVLWVHGKTVGLRDATLPKATPSAESMSYINVSSTMQLSSLVENPVKSSLNSNGIADWVIDGFNACVFAYGNRGQGKTLALFGPEQNPILSAPIAPNNVAPQDISYDNLLDDNKK